MKKKYKLKKANIIIALVFVLCLGTISIAGYKLIRWKLDTKDIEKQLEIIEEEVSITEEDDTDDTEIIEQTNIEEDNPYWDYIKEKLINVNFDELKGINSDIKGWIQVNGTNINYPFVQTNNNSYYLTHNINKKYNAAGWVFLDYRNKIDDLNQNTILYAHGRLDQTMFGSLRNILSSGWLSNTDNYIVKMSTATENTLWQVFSVYKIKTTNDYLTISFTDENYKTFTDMLIDRSAFNFKTSLNNTDKILTLSTCYDSEYKIVLHAKLIKITKK